MLCYRLVSQAIQNVRETQHQLLHIAGINNGRLFFALFVECSHGLKNRNNGLVREAHQSGVLGEQAAAQVVQTRR